MKKLVEDLFGLNKWRDMRTVCGQNVECVEIKIRYWNSHPTIDEFFQELMIVKNQEYYEQLFELYPDVVILDEFRAMLGSIGETTARKILRGNNIRYFFIRCAYRISKIWIIEYVLIDHYVQYRQVLKVKF